MESTPVPPAPPAPEPIRLIVVDDDSGIRTLLEVSVSLDPRFELVGTAASAGEALRVLADLGDARVDLVLLDVTLPDRDGIEVLGDVRAAAHGARVALFTGWNDPETLERATRAGADGIFPKDGSPRKLLDSLAAMCGAQPEP
ncbi:MAG: response regulator receiver protein [Thermoleophilia bacterium]|nr:response regulator receiver protein [Thermoleophilia bacterium]